MKEIEMRRKKNKNKSFKVNKPRRAKKEKKRPSYIASTAAHWYIFSLSLSIVFYSSPSLSPALFIFFQLIFFFFFSCFYCCCCYGSGCILIEMICFLSLSFISSKFIHFQRLADEKFSTVTNLVFFLYFTHAHKSAHS